MNNIMDVHEILDFSKINENTVRFKKLPFSASERELIVALVRERPIIEDKRTNANNIVLKKQAWEDLAVAFNSQPYVSPRKTVQLKRCWENIKSQRKKELSQESMSMRRTGGGPPESGCSASSDNMVDIICPFINLTVPGVIDSNSIEISEVPCYSQDQTSPEYNKNNEPTEIDTVKKMTYEHYSGLKNNSSPLQKRKLTKEISENKLKSELELRKKRCTMNIKYDQQLHESRIERERILIERERILIEREKNLLEYEKKSHKLQLDKLKLEIDRLTNNNN